MSKDETLWTVIVLPYETKYRQISNISRTLVGNKTDVH